MTDTELKPCPFCGGAPEILLYGNDYKKKRSTAVACKKCNYQLEVGAIQHSHQWTTTKAVEKWNTRAPASPQEVEQ